MEEKKKACARSALEVVPARGVIGLGSGSTVAYLIEFLGEIIRESGYDLRAVPSSYQSYLLAVEHGIPIVSLDEAPVLDLTIDGADEVDSKLNLTKGGGGALFREKVVASASKRFVIIVDDSKIVEHLGTRSRIPIEVLPFALRPVIRSLKEMGIVPHLRGATKKLGPVVTDNGNFIVDLDFPSPIVDPHDVNHRLKMIPGVIETGLFVGMCDEVHVAHDEGVRVLKRTQD